MNKRPGGKRRAFFVCMRWILQRSPALTPFAMKIASLR